MTEPASGGVTLLEREAELAVLGALLPQVAAGRGRAALITAPAGLGKSALLDVVERRTAALGWQTRRAAHAREESDLPLSVVRTLLEAPLLERPDAAHGHVAARRAAELLVEGTASHDLMATNVAHGVFWLCSALSADRPLVLLVDDAQWSDVPSLRVLAYLARRVADLRVLLVLVARTVDGIAPDAIPVAGTAPDLFAGIRDVVVLTPQPLGPPASAEVVRAAAPGIGADEARAIAGAAGGVPWLLLELASREPDGSPLVRRRLAWLSEPERRLARALAVLGEDADQMLLAELTGIATTRLGTVYEGLEAAGLAEIEAWRLTHPVIGRAALATTRTGTLERLHAAAARGLVERRAPADRVAGHLLRCPPAADPEASATLRAAAQEAADRGDPGRAAACLERALLERAPGDDRAAMLAQLGALRFHAGDDDARSRLHEGMAESDDEEVRVELLTRLSALEIVDPRDERLERHLPEQGAAGGGDLGLAAELAALDALVVRPQRHAERARRTRALDPDATRDAELRSAALAHRAWIAMETGDLPAARTAELARRAVAGDVLLETSGRRAAYHLAIRTLVYADALDDAADAITRLRTFASEQGSVRLLTTAGWYASELALRSGRLADAEREARRALAPLDDGDIVGAGPLEVLVAALVERGELCAAEDELGAREAVWREANGWEAGVRHSRARLLLAEGRYADAEEQAREVGRLRVAQGRVNPSWTPWRSTLALALARRGRQGDAAVVADEELAAARSFDGPIAIAVAEHARCVAEPDHAERARRARAALDAEVPSPLVRARLEVELGAALVRLRRRTEGRAPLRSALAVADAVGAAPLAEQARRELVASGARPRRAALSGARSLTPRQLQIAELAAAGRANREIADELFLSVKTVETHLAAAYEKLGITERGELGAALGAAQRPPEP